ncbi:MAG: hypothetical protein ACK53L_14285, partial [Pirellulaceae bacterium]
DHSHDHSHDQPEDVPPPSAMGLDHDDPRGLSQPEERLFREDRADREIAPWEHWPDIAFRREDEPHSSPPKPHWDRDIS